LSYDGLNLTILAIPAAVTAHESGLWLDSRRPYAVTYLKSSVLTAYEQYNLDWALTMIKDSCKTFQVSTCRVSVHRISAILLLQRLHRCTKQL